MNLSDEGCQRLAIAIVTMAIEDVVIMKSLQQSVVVKDGQPDDNFSQSTLKECMKQASHYTFPLKYSGVWCESELDLALQIQSRRRANGRARYSEIMRAGETAWSFLHDYGRVSTWLDVTPDTIDKIIERKLQSGDLTSHKRRITGQYQDSGRPKGR